MVEADSRSISTYARRSSACSPSSSNFATALRFVDYLILESRKHLTHLERHVGMICGRNAEWRVGGLPSLRGRSQDFNIASM